MPFSNRDSGVQADFIPEDETPKASHASDRVDVTDGTGGESAVAIATARSIALGESEVSGPEAI
ncbi:MAG TPA: hypothetical protein VNN79_02680 [Actinomycetota bacterium]|jgi:hypothetical protein|nr:hypothetical protein [Actinomycetota bacterium]